MVARNEIVAAIPSNGQLSNLVDGGGMRLAGIYLPSNFQGTSLTLLAAPANSQYGQGFILSNNSGNISFTVAANQYIGFDQNANTNGIAKLQIKAGSSQSSGAANILTVWVPWSA